MKEENRLTRREQEVAKLLLQGKSNKQIAAALHVTGRTVEAHLTSIYEKLQVGSRMEAFSKLRETTLGGSTIAENHILSENVDSERRPAAIRGISLEEIIRFLVTYKIPISLWIILTIAIVSAFMLWRRTPWKYEREGEYPDEATVGQVLQRTNASKEMVHGQFGTIPAWPAQPGYVKYDNIKTPRLDHLFLRLRYSKYSASSVPILVYLDDETSPRAIILPVDQGSWEKFIWTDTFDLGSVKRGVHSIKFYTDGQVYGVADLDRFVLTQNSNRIPLTLEPIGNSHEHLKRSSRRVFFRQS
jgi:DNA-binding CsgD family transcriptional regulator